MPNQKPEVAGFYDEKTGSIQYVVIDNATNQCAIIDPVLNFDEKAARTSNQAINELENFISQRELTVSWILDTHPHADHFTAAYELGKRYAAPRAIGEKVVEVQALWKDIYNLDADFATDGRQWDKLFADGDMFNIGNLEGRVIWSPGHTLASVTYIIGDAAFVHDTIFMPDSGTARADFPGGDAKMLYQSIQDILALPEQTRLFTGHDYRPNGREPLWESTVAEQKSRNIHAQYFDDEAAFIAMRQQRDATLPLPNLMLESLQINIVGGRLPAPENNGRSYLKIPLNYFATPKS